MLGFPNCKINLGLQITERRPDGYHNLNSCFYPVGWSDVVEVIEDHSLTVPVQFTATGIPIPGDPDPAKNLCVKAYHALRADHDLPPVRIHLHKIVPIGAGLGGGSADAALVLKQLNGLFELGLSLAQLESYARPLGADCAFFIQNRPMYCVQKGDMFEEIKVDLSGYSIQLIYPNLAISTAEAYAGIRPRQPETPLRALLEAPIAGWRDRVHNDFEDSLFPKYPILADLKAQLYEQGAVYAAMSGSGSTVFGIFSGEPNGDEAFGRYTVWQGKL
ncbi:MAG: 4-(cytidine 5'-diphospho)-2-C-methyl-D-erythritol kinase [Cytophagales bacterium]|nr:MAG: 4-(cytidine 5'-diphospho)-2-C-methyl-D-erythritol kinase [Cytophagales bacterium]